MKRFLFGLALGAGFAALLTRRKHHHLAERTRDNIERTGQQLNELVDRMHRSEELLRTTEQQVSRAHRHTRSRRHQRRPA